MSDKVFESLDRSYKDKKEELRVALGEFNGKQFASLRLWWKGQDGEFRPDKTKGITVRPKELRKVIEALERLERELTGEVPPTKPDNLNYGPPPIQDDDVPF